MSGPLLILCTCPDAESAGRIASALVEERLAACVNRVPGLTSVYRWQGKIQEDSEVLLLIKSRGELFESLRARLVALHPYDVPEVIALGIAAGHAPYLEWLCRETSV
ncbi:MAG TPA: divalent-cation tolerance protein CutA [Rhodanobacteraceae bacterium]|nr:divalent-cation tolerance protein CutA [Rhodanobacteraceae bacterium]